MIYSTTAWVDILGSATAPKQPKDIAFDNDTGLVWILDEYGRIFSYMDDP